MIEMLNKLPERIRASLSDTDWRVYAKADDDSVDLMLHGVVGDYTEKLDSRSVAGFLRQHSGKSVNVSINSPGGLVFDGIAIHNALSQHEGPTTATIEALAASASTIVALGADTVRMYDNAKWMVHRAWGVAIGNKDYMEDMADVLAKIDASIVNTYAAKTGASIEALTELMVGKVDGTYMTAAEAKEWGFVDEIIVPKTQSKIAKASTAKTPQEEVRSKLKAKAAVEMRLRLLDIMK